MIRVKIKLFASFKDILGCPSLEVELSKGAKIADLCSILAEKDEKWHEIFSQARNKVKVACNQQMADMDCTLSSDDEIGFFPPVTGG